MDTNPATMKSVTVMAILAKIPILAVLLSNVSLAAETVGRVGGVFIVADLMGSTEESIICEVVMLGLVEIVTLDDNVTDTTVENGAGADSESGPGGAAIVELEGQLLEVDFSDTAAFGVGIFAVFEDTGTGPAVVAGEADKVSDSVTMAKSEGWL
jgi:hypothetical protein